MATGEIQLAPPSLMTVIERLASNPNVDLDKLQRLLEMQERWQMNQARIEFREAMAEFKKNPPEIVKSRIAKVQTKAGGTFTYSYADLEAITSAIVADLAERGITHDYETKQVGTDITVTCFMHRGAYSTPGVTLTAGPDDSGTKNAIQAVASTVSYLEKYTLLGAAGMAAGMPDTDANIQAGMSPDERQKHVKAIESATSEAELKTAYFESCGAADAVKDTGSSRVFADAKNKRLGELKRAKSN